MPRIIVAAPYPTVRAGLKTALGEAADLDVIAEAGDIDTLLTLFEEEMPDVLLVDLVDAPDDWITTLAGLADENELPPVVMMAGAPNGALVGFSIPNTSLLLRDASLDEIIAAVRAAAIGLITLDFRIAGEIREQLEWQGYLSRDDAITLLTPRELEVLHGISRGLPNKTIASELGISEHTVKFHVGSIFGKLGVASRSEAIAVAARRGLLVL